MLGFNKILQDVLKSKKRQYEERKQALKPNLGIVLELIRQGILNNYTNMLKGLMEKSTHYARTDG